VVAKPFLDALDVHPAAQQQRGEMVPELMHPSAALDLGPVRYPGPLAAAGRRSRVTVIGLIDAQLIETGLSGSIAAAEQSVSAAGAPAFAARHLGCDAGEPLLRIDRLYFDGEDTPVELAISYFDPEHYSYRVKLRRRSRWLGPGQAHRRRTSQRGPAGA
jgi:hypothetical protein